MDRLWPWGLEAYVLDELAHGILPEHYVPPALPLSQQNGSYSSARLEYDIAVFRKPLIIREEQPLAVFGMGIAGVYREMNRANSYVPRVSLQEIFATE
jgi:hypothetical protein